MLPANLAGAFDCWGRRGKRGFSYLYASSLELGEATIRGKWEGRDYASISLRSDVSRVGRRRKERHIRTTVGR